MSTANLQQFVNKLYSISNNKKANIPQIPNDFYDGISFSQIIYILWKKVIHIHEHPNNFQEIQENNFMVFQFFQSHNCYPCTEPIPSLDQLKQQNSPIILVLQNILSLLNNRRNQLKASSSKPIQTPPSSPSKVGETDFSTPSRNRLKAILPNQANNLSNNSNDPSTPPQYPQISDENSFSLQSPPHYPKISDSSDLSIVLPNVPLFVSPVSPISPISPNSPMSPLPTNNQSQQALTPTPNHKS